MDAIGYEIRASKAVEEAGRTGDPDAVEICRSYMETSIRLAARDRQDARFNRRMTECDDSRSCR